MRIAARRLVTLEQYSRRTNQLTMIDGSTISVPEVEVTREAPVDDGQVLAVVNVRPKKKFIFRNILRIRELLMPEIPG